MPHPLTSIQNVVFMVYIYHHHFSVEIETLWNIMLINSLIGLIDSPMRFSFNFDKFNDKNNSNERLRVYGLSYKCNSHDKILL